MGFLFFGGSEYIVRKDHGIRDRHHGSEHGFIPRQGYRGGAQSVTEKLMDAAEAPSEIASLPSFHCLTASLPQYLINPRPPKSSTRT
jgi:hypothetical protein